MIMMVNDDDYGNLIAAHLAIDCDGENCHGYDDYLIAGRPWAWQSTA